MALGLALVKDATSTETLAQAPRTPVLLAVVVVLTPVRVVVALGVPVDETAWPPVEREYVHEAVGPSGVKTLGPDLPTCSASACVRCSRRQCTCATASLHLTYHPECGLLSQCQSSPFGIASASEALSAATMAAFFHILVKVAWWVI